ncbi:hypothetical protein FS749_010372 [Ceratobasidium sp. UAMH 11750]|nr:hypothetical protein FS749_010372 [Ceratobasidium sp. UAMH 11750]
MPTKSHPSSSNPYRQASNLSHSWLASAPQAPSTPHPHGLGPNNPPLDLCGAHSRSPLDQSPTYGP